MKKIITVCLILLFALAAVSVCYAQTQETLHPDQAANHAQTDVEVSEQATEPPQDDGFRLQWYHYAVAAAIIFGMSLYTLKTVKPISK